MSKRCGLSRNSASKRSKLSITHSNSTSQQKCSSSPPLIDDDIVENLNEPSSSKSTLTPKRTSTVLSKSALWTTASRIEVPSAPPVRSYFETVLLQNGIILSTGDGDEIHSSKFETKVLIENIKNFFLNDINHPYNIEDFLKSFEKFISDKNAFKKLLTATIWLPEENTTHLEKVQLSIIQTLLRIDFMQTKIINILLDELTKYSVEDNLSDGIVWVRHILGQLRDLYFYVDGEAFVKKLILIIDISGDNEKAQYELICSLPRITLEQQHDLIALELSRILSENFELTGVILDNLGRLCTSKSVREQICTQVLDLLKAAAPLGKMHNLTNYLMGSCTRDNALYIIESLRKSLDWGSVTLTIPEAYKSERSSSQVLTLGIIRSKLTFSLFLSEIWTKYLLSYESYKDYKTFDLIIFFIICISSHKRRNYYESVICKRIGAGLLKDSLLEKTFRDFYSVIRDNFQKFIDLFEVFIKNKQQEVAEFGGLCYKFAIVHQDQPVNDQQRSSSSITKTVLTHLVRNAQFCKQRRNTALSVLTELCSCSRSVMCDNATMLMPLLNSIDSLSLSDMRVAMDVLCSAAYPPPNQRVGLQLQSDIEIYIPKKLASHKIQEMKRGIISCVAAVKHIGRRASARIEHDEGCSNNTSINSISELSMGGPKEAAILIESMFLSTKGFPQLQGMSYDELSSTIMLRSSKINNQIINWLCDAITNDFLQYFVADSLEEELNGFKLTQQHCLNPVESEKPSFMINIAPLVFKSNNSNDVILLCPLFRLLRILQQQLRGDLEIINAVLGYPVAMPLLDANESLDEFDFEKRNLFVDCLFHCINWFRECISAFITQSDKTMQINVMARLRSLVSMEKQFFKLVNEYGIDYKPPTSNFYNEQQVIKIPKNRKTTKNIKPKASDGNETSVLQGTSTATQPAEKKAQNSKCNENQSALIFRNFDNTVIQLLKKTLVVNENKDDNSISMAEMAYILQDIVTKLEIIKASKKSEHQQMIETPIDLINNIKDVIPNLMDNLNIIANVLRDALKEGDDIRDAHVLFFDKSMQAKLCVELVMKILAEIFNWSDFSDIINNNLLKEMLIGISKESEKSHPLEKIALISMNNICDYKDIILTLTSAANFAKLLYSLAKLTEDAEFECKLVTICNELLHMEWYNELALADKGSKCNINLEVLLKYSFYKADLKTIVRVVNSIKEEVSTLKKLTDNLKTFPNFYKTNFPLLYKNVFTAFVEAVQHRIGRPLSSTQHLRFWEAIMNTLGKLMTIVKEQNARPNLNTFLKRTYVILKLFLTRGMAGLEACLRNNADEVTNILKTMQQSTRFINSICVQAKTTKDGNLMAHVPKMLKVLESLIYSVKAALAANNCSTAFMMGNLINRNVHGDIIPTQSSYVTETNSVDELPPDDTESESDPDPEDHNTESRSKLY